LLSTLASGSAHPESYATPLASSGSQTDYTPWEIRQAYGINQAVLPNGQPATGYGETIAIIVAGDDPNIEHDLAVFDQTFGLPAPPWFAKVMQSNTPASTTWGQETALDVEWAHAIAPQANILLVEAASDSYNNLIAGAAWAASVPTVVAVSMSWAGPEFAGETAFDAYLTTPAFHLGGWGAYGGVTFVAASGDNGAWSGPQYPAVSPYVLSVGGTSLFANGDSSYNTELAWSGSQGGYSTQEPEPTYQWGSQGSWWRTSPDVAYDGDPNTGLLVYNSYQAPAGSSGWWISGGTSAGAPQWAAILALADEARNSVGLGSLGNAQAALYSLPAGDFHDIIYGNNGFPAMMGYDLVTGLGTPLVDRIVWDLLSAPTYSSVTLMWTPPSQNGIGGASIAASSEPAAAGSAGMGLLGAQQINSLVAQARLELSTPSAPEGTRAPALSDTFWQHLDAAAWSELEQLLLGPSLGAHRRSLGGVGTDSGGELG
jgi:subtilase family serine protease